MRSSSFVSEEGMTTFWSLVHTFCRSRFTVSITCAHHALASELRSLSPNVRTQAPEARGTTGSSSVVSCSPPPAIVPAHACGVQRGQLNAPSLGSSARASVYEHEPVAPPAC